MWRGLFIVMMIIMITRDANPGGRGSWPLKICRRVRVCFWPSLKCHRVTVHLKIHTEYSETLHSVDAISEFATSGYTALHKRVMTCQWAAAVAAVAASDARLVWDVQSPPKLKASCQSPKPPSPERWTVPLRTIIGFNINTLWKHTRVCDVC